MGSGKSARVGINDLPVDVLRLITGHIHRPTDLVALCQSSKKLYEVAVESLYRCVRLRVGGENDTRVMKMMNPRNPGLSHIRELDLWHDEQDDYSETQSSQSVLIVCLILELLPGNCLERFRWHPWAKFSAENLALLYKRQKKMKGLEAITLDKPFNSHLKKKLDIDSLFKNGPVEELAMWLDSRDALAYGHELVKRADKLRKLTIKSSFTNEGDPEPQELSDGIDGPGLITRTLFAHKLPFSEVTNPLVVSELFLNDVSLRHTSSTYGKVISFPKLKNLRIHTCSGADSFFSEISKSSQLPSNLHTLEFKHEDDSKECEGIRAVIAFLCMIKGLERITIDVWKVSKLPDVKCITRHGKTLKLLSVHACVGGDDSDDEYVYDFTDLEKICKESPNLEQLSLAFPKTHILKKPSAKYGAYLRHMFALGSLPNLVTLNITTWPAMGDCKRQIPKRTYMDLLAGHAQKMFEKSIKGANRKKMRVVNAASSESNNNDSASASGESGAMVPGDNTDDQIVASDEETADGDETASDEDTSLPDITSRVPLPSFSKLSLVAYGTTDRPYEASDSDKTVIFCKGKQYAPTSLHSREKPVAVRIGWCLRKTVEPRSEILDFPLCHRMGTPTVDDSDISDSDD